MTDQIIFARRRTRDNWIADARKSFRPGRRRPCEVCSKFRYIAEAHHIVPLGHQFDCGAGRPDHAHAWLCPNHHRMLHLLIDGDPPVEVLGRRAADVFSDMDEQEWRRLRALFQRAGGQRA